MNGKLIIVSGLPRSGTSMMMKMLEAGGIPVLTDNLRTPDVDNPKGYYEFEKVKKLKEDTSWIPGARGHVVKMVAMLLRDLPEAYEYDVLFMRRAMKEVLASQRKMLSRLGRDQGLEDAKMSAIYSKHLEDLDKWLATKPNIRVLDVDYAEAIGQPALCAAQVAEFLGRPLDVQAMAAVVDGSLYRNREGALR